MRNKDWKTNIAHEALIILGVLALLTFIAAILMVLTLLVNLLAVLVGRWFKRRQKL